MATLTKQNSPCVTTLVSTIHANGVATSISVENEATMTTVTTTTTTTTPSSSEASSNSISYEAIVTTAETVVSSTSSSATSTSTSLSSSPLPCRLLMLPPELVLIILCRLDLVTLYRIRRLHSSWTPLVLDALTRHLHRTSVLLTFEQEERWRLRIEIPFLHFDARTLLCTFVPQRDPRTARRYYRSLFLRQPVLRAVRRQTRWDRGHGICILRRSANLLDRPWAVEIQRPGLHRIARQDAAGRDWECVYYVTRDRPISSTTTTSPLLSPVNTINNNTNITTSVHNNHSNNTNTTSGTHHPAPFSLASPTMDFLVPHDRNDIIMEHAPAALLSSLMPLSPNLSTITPSRFINTVPSNNNNTTTGEHRRSGERWLCPAIFQCHLGFLIGIGASTPITAVSGRETRKVLRDPDADLVRYEPGKPPPSFSTMAWLARWFNRVISPHQHYDNTRFSSERRTASAFPLNFQNRPMTAEASLRAHHQLPLLRYTSAPIPLSNTTDLPNDRRTLSTLQANSRSLFSNFVSLISLRRHRLIQTPTTTAATTGSAATLASSSRTTATTATTVTTTTAPVFRVYEH